ncbi:MAG: hypothetical protein Q8P53_04125 [Candidatus Shapirobacteria bacterium]|nr:hypothetical protein [Candidatus Shapirobacteria bacterium]
MKNLEKNSEKLTNWIGTPSSIIVHTILFIGIFSLKLFGFTIDNILLVLTTAVSLEAIYLAIFIQMSVNRTTKSLTGVEKDIDNIQIGVREITEDQDEEEEDEDEMIKEIKGIEKRLIKLHEAIVEINKHNAK